MSTKIAETNLCLHQPETYSGIEVAVNLKRWTALTFSPSQFCVYSGTLTYKNVNLRHRHSRHFWLTFLQAFINCDCGSISSEELISWSRKQRVTSQDKQASMHAPQFGTQYQ